MGMGIQGSSLIANNPGQQDGTPLAWRRRGKRCAASDGCAAPIGEYANRGYPL